MANIKGTAVHTEGNGRARFVISSDGEAFFVYVYHNGEGNPELIGTGHNMRSAMAFVTLHKPTKAKPRKPASLSEMRAWLAR